MNINQNKSGLIPISKPQINDLDISFIKEAASSGWVSSLGPYLDQLENKFAEFCNTEYCVLTSNGTVALHLALLSLGIKENDEIIVPELTFVATANAVKMCGAIPVIVDVDPLTWCIDPIKCQEKISNRTKAIIPVHLYGFPSNMLELVQLAKKNNIRIIEDCAEAHGAKLNGKVVGSFGDAGIFSFYGNKIITTGEGGAIVTNSYEIAKTAKYFRDHAMSQSRKYWHDNVGYNYRMTNIQAALGLSQLMRIDSFLARRSEILEIYKRNLEPHGFRLNPSICGIEPVNWLTCVQLANNESNIRDKIINKMQDSAIECRPFFYPLTVFPMYRSPTGPIAKEVSSKGICLPTFVDIANSDIERICDIFISSACQ